MKKKNSCKTFPSILQITFLKDSENKLVTDPKLKMGLFYEYSINEYTYILISGLTVGSLRVVNQVCL